VSERVVGGVDDRGRAIARKRPATAAHRSALRWEAQALAAAAHPGVVELLGVDDDGLATIYAGTHSLATCAPLAVERIAALGAALAATVADLHALGIVHGRIDPSHVIVGPDGRPLLCSFSGATVGGRAAPSGASDVAEGFGDPRHQPGEPVPPTADVYAVGVLIRFLLDRGGGRSRPHAGRRRSLASVARRATAIEPHRRPMARDLAAQLGAGRPLPRRPAIVAAGVGGALLLLGTLALAVFARGRAAPRDDVQVSATGVGAPPPPTTSAPAPTTPPGPAPEVVGPNLVAVGADRYEAGAPGDQVVLGDWDCDGEATVALLRPGTGEVFVFDSWPTAGHDRTIPPTTVVSEPVRAAADDSDRDHCPDLVVERDGGADVVVEVAR
jgi:hypothetical protein